jgi:putative acetyltransferase
MCGRLLAVAALRTLNAMHAEIKSMHTAEEARGQGVGNALLKHMLTAACGQGYARVSLETGQGEAFAPARLLYCRSGFEICPPFGDYRISADSVCMTLNLSSP